MRGLKSSVLYSELKISFKNGKSFTYKRVLEFGVNNEEFVMKTKTHNGPRITTLKMENIESIQEFIKREIKI